MHSILKGKKKADGRVYAWGHARALGTRTNLFSAVAVPYLGTETAKVVKVACGAEHSVALTADGVVYTFGSNTADQLGITEQDIAVATRGFSLEHADVAIFFFSLLFSTVRYHTKLNLRIG